MSARSRRDFDANGWQPRVVPPSQKVLPGTYAVRDAERNLRAWNALECEVARWNGEPLPAQPLVDPVAIAERAAIVEEAA